MSGLLMIVPSRGRPANIAELLKAWRGTRTPGLSQLLVAVDDDDPELAGYRQVCLAEPGPRLEIGPRERIGPTLNRLATGVADEHFAVGFMGDDHRPRTEGWDQAMVDALREMGSGIVYGNDLFQGENLPTAVAMTSDIVRALGFMVPPGLVHMYFDNFWLGLGRSLGRIRYLPDVVIEHMHPLAQKAEWDAGYLAVNSQAVLGADRARLLEWLEREEPAALGRVREAIVARAPA